MRHTVVFHGEHGGQSSPNTTAPTSGENRKLELCWREHGKNMSSRGGTRRLQLCWREHGKNPPSHAIWSLHTQAPPLPCIHTHKESADTNIACLSVIILSVGVQGGK